MSQRGRPTRGAPTRSTVPTRGTAPTRGTRGRRGAPPAAAQVPSSGPLSSAACRINTGTRANESGSQRVQSNSGQDQENGNEEMEDEGMEDDEERKLGRIRKYQTFAENTEKEAMNKKRRQPDTGLNEEKKIAREERKRERQAIRAQLAREQGIAVEELGDEEEDEEEECDNESADMDDIDDLGNGGPEFVEEHNRRNLLLYAVFAERFPKLMGRLRESLQHNDRATFNSCLSTMHKSLLEVRRWDSTSLKSKVLSWLPRAFDLTPKSSEGAFEFPDPETEKDERGVNNRVICLFFAPHSRMKDAWGKSSVTRKALLKDMQDHQLVLRSRDMPAFLYDISLFRKSNIWKGLFRGPMLVYGYRHIFTGPQSALKGPQKKRRRGRPGVYKKLCLYQVTIETIAYIAIQIRFSLCSLEEWNFVDGEFDFKDFFYFIIRTFWDATEKWRHELIEWWNIQIFGEVIDTANMEMSPEEQMLESHDPDALTEDEDEPDTDTEA